MRKIFFFLTSYLLLCYGTLLFAYAEKPIVVVTPSYNNSLYYKQNLDSIFQQHYSNWHLIYIDDCSADGTAELVEQYIKERGFQHKVTLIKNNERKLALANLYNAIHSCDDHTIIVSVDGDDFLAQENVFSYINNVYSSGNIWITYGEYMFLSSKRLGCCREPDHDIIENNLFREYVSLSHLRTFYAGLFKKIKIEDLQLNGAFYTMTYDTAITMPMIEMARNGHFACINKVLLIYNDLNVINDHKVSRELQEKISKHIRSLPKYEALTSLFN